MSGQSTGEPMASEKKAREVHRQNGGTPEDEVGRVERKVEAYGELCWGR